MSKKKFSLYLHLIWSTWNRENWISSDIERRVYRIIVSQVQRFKCQTIAINGMGDHIHLLVKFPAAMMIAELVK